MSSDPDASKQGSLIAADVILMCLSLTAVIMRLIARRISAARFWYDDYIIIAALFFAYGPSTCNLVAVHFGFGLHENATRPDAASKWYELLYIFEQFYSPAIATIKLSILLFYARVFTNKNFRKQLYAVSAVVILWWIACQFTTMFECTPIHYFWTAESDVEGHCIAIQKYFLGQAIPSIITDLIILILLLPRIWSLNLPTSQKIALSSIFLLGSFVTFASIYRLVLLTRLTQVDVTWNYADAAIWSAIEPHVGIVSACLPTLRPLYIVFRRTVTTIAGINSNETSPHHSTPSKKVPNLLWSHGVPAMGLQDEELLSLRLKAGAQREDFELHEEMSNTNDSRNYARSTPDTPFNTERWYDNSEQPVPLTSIRVKKEFGISSTKEGINPVSDNKNGARSSRPIKDDWYNRNG